MCQCFLICHLFLMNIFCCFSLIMYFIFTHCFLPWVLWYSTATSFKDKSNSSMNPAEAIGHNVTLANRNKALNHLLCWWKTGGHANHTYSDPPSCCVVCWFDIASNLDDGSFVTPQVFLSLSCHILAFSYSITFYPYMSGWLTLLSWVYFLMALSYHTVSVKVSGLLADRELFINQQWTRAHLCTSVLSFPLPSLVVLSSVKKTAKLPPTQFANVARLERNDGRFSMGLLCSSTITFILDQYHGSVLHCKE